VFPKIILVYSIFDEELVKFEICNKASLINNLIEG
jgi:hypothetical protein